MLPWEAVAGDWMEAVIGAIRLTNLGTMVCAWAQTMVLHQPPVSTELDRLPLESAVSSTGAAVLIGWLPGRSRTNGSIQEGRKRGETFVLQTWGKNSQGHEEGSKQVLNQKCKIKF